MAEIELDAVVEFLRKNGLSESESALVEDVLEKSDLGSSLLEKFFFPMVAPPPPVRIPGNPSSRMGGAGVESLDGSSDDDFVSLGSSAAELYPSEFINPYGILAARPASRASSEGMSQFGTARDYADFDMQNDLFWYKERDEDYAMPPLFVAGDMDGEPSEDKFITTIQSEGTLKKRNSLPGGSSNKKLMSSEEAYEGYYNSEEHFLPEKELGEHHDEYKCSSPLCACCNGATTAYLESRGPAFDHWNGHVNPMLDLHTDNNNESVTSDNDNDEYVEGSAIMGDAHEHEVATNNETAAVSDELLIYERSDDDDYEVFDLRIIHRRNRTGFEENKDFPIVISSIIAGRYYVTEYIGSAAFSKVVQAHDLQLGIDVCLKIIKNDKEFFDQSLDEIKLLKFVNKHDPADSHHILRLYDYFYFQEHLLIVTELLGANLYEYQKFNKESGGEPYFTMPRLQAITRQCLEALCYLHDLGIIHCDLKPENIVLKSYRRCEIKIIDLGSSCFLRDNLSLYIQSRSYRAPEVMLGLPYNEKIDLWSIGCIIAELYSGEVLFPNEAVLIILARIIGILGPIDMRMLEDGQETHKYFTEDDYQLFFLNEETNEVKLVIPEASSLENELQIVDVDSSSGFVDFLKCLLEINPNTRPTAREALKHPWLASRRNC